MLESPGFANQPVNRALVYELRQRALHRFDLADALALIAERLAIPNSEIGCFAIVLYLRLAFGVGVYEGKVLTGFLERSERGYLITDTTAGDSVTAQAEANRHEWCNLLHAVQP